MMFWNQLPAFHLLHFKCNKQSPFVQQAISLLGIESAWQEFRGSFSVCDRYSGVPYHASPTNKRYTSKYMSRTGGKQPAWNDMRCAQPVPDTLCYPLPCRSVYATDSQVQACLFQDKGEVVCRFCQQEWIIFKTPPRDSLPGWSRE